MAGFYQGGTFAALIIVFLIFHFHWLSYEQTFILLGVVAVLGGVAIFRFPHLHDGQLRKVAPKRERIVWRRDYRYYYALNLLDGVRQQVFFSFGLWVLVNQFGAERLRRSPCSSCGHVRRHHGLVAAWGAPSTGWASAGSSRPSTSGTSSRLPATLWPGHVALACFFYVIYAFISPFSSIASSTYLRKIAVPEDIAPSLAMGVTLLHATAIVVPVAAGVHPQLRRLPGPVLHRLRRRAHDGASSR